MILPNELLAEPKMPSKKALGVTTKTLAHGTMKGPWYTGEPYKLLIVLDAKFLNLQEFAII